MPSGGERPQSGGWSPEVAPFDLIDAHVSSRSPSTRRFLHFPLPDALTARCVLSMDALSVIEIKADEDLHLALQSLDYWVRVRQHHQATIHPNRGVEK